MKKFIVFAVVLALLVPAAAFAVTEFSLGGFIKLDAMWDSNNSVGKNIYAVPSRNNNGDANHGRLKFTAQGSRFNFTIKGPTLWGAQITGFMEIDFDGNDLGGAGAPGFNGGVNASSSYVPRLRHAMFRFNWPTSELLFGQYFSMFSEWYAESAEDGPLQMTGTPTARLAQIRFTQKFLSDWTVAGLIGNPNQTVLSGATYANASYNNGQYAETPQVQAKVQYQHDFWGKAAYYGKPIPFTAQIVAGWQRAVQRGSTFPTTTLNGLTGGFFSGQDGAQYGTGTINVQNQYLNPWLLMGSLFIPVIPTHSANLAGTAHILTNAWVGQGVDAFGFTGGAGGTTGGNNLYELDNRKFANAAFTNQFNYSASLLKRFGTMVEGQYYFNNQWFFNAVYGYSKAYGVSRARSNWIPGTQGVNGMEWALTGDIPQTIQQVNATLWYRPIQAIKFGLQYSYACATYFQYLNPATTAAPPAGFNPGGNNVNRSHFGDDHRVEFVGFFYF
jgi:hypothetical protein